MSRKEEIRSFVGKKIRSMQTGAATAGTKAALADLRRGVGREPGEMPQLFGTSSDSQDNLTGTNPGTSAAWPFSMPEKRPWPAWFRRT